MYQLRGYNKITWKRLVSLSSPWTDGSTTYNTDDFSFLVFSSHKIYQNHILSSLGKVQNILIWLYF